MIYWNRLHQHCQTLEFRSNKKQSNVIWKLKFANNNNGTAIATLQGGKKGGAVSKQNCHIKNNVRKVIRMGLLRYDVIVLTALPFFNFWAKVIVVNYFISCVTFFFACFNVSRLLVLFFIHNSSVWRALSPLSSSIWHVLILKIFDFCAHNTLAGSRHIFS